MNRSAERNITCVIAGSFRHKDLIDDYRHAFERWGVVVLQPPSGQPKQGTLYIPTGEEVRRYGNSARPFWPLAQEVGKSIKQIEDEFLTAIGQASLMYIVTVDQHIGLSASMEAGFALASETPIYTNELPRVDDWPSTEALLAEEANVASVPEAIEAVGSNLSLDFWLPKGAREHDTLAV